MVAYGFLPAETVDKFGDTMGGIGSAISVKDFKQGKNGTFSGRIVVSRGRLAFSGVANIGICRLNLVRGLQECSRKEE